MLKKLVPDAIDGQGFAGVMNGRVRFDALDRPANPTRIRLGATVVRVTNMPNGSVEVVSPGREAAQDDRRPRRDGERRMDVAVRRADVPESFRDAFTDFVRAPMLVVNVALRRWRFMYDLGITAASYRDLLGFSCNSRQWMVVGDYRPTLHPDKPTILTFYIPFERPGTAIKPQAAAARTEMLGTSYRDYERKIREQLVRLFARAGFDPRA